MAGTMLDHLKNYLDITYEDAQVDKKLSGIMERGKAYLDNVAGGELDYDDDNIPRQLLFDYCRYARNNVLEMFEENFKAELIALRIGVQTDDYAKQQEYI